MSNALAVASVTSSLRVLLARSISVVPGAQVSTVRPDALGVDSLERGVNIFLYLVTNNAAFENADVPTRRADGSLMSVPTAALDLHYILSFYGDESKLEPQLLLGSTVAILRQRPTLTPALIKETIAATTIPDLTTSDLALQRPPVGITPGRLDPETLARIWPVFFQTRYYLSVSYICSPVLVEASTSATVNPLAFPGVNVEVGRRKP